MDKWAIKNLKLAKIMKALLASYVATGLLLLLLAGMMYKFELDEGKVSIGIIAIYIVSCLLGGFLTGKFVKAQKFIWGMALGAVYFIILTLISLAVNRGFQGNLMNLATTFIMCVGGGMLGGMIS